MNERQNKTKKRKEIHSSIYHPVGYIFFLCIPQITITFDMFNYYYFR